MARLYGAAKVLELLSAVLLTGRLKQHRPVSIVLIAPPANGKTATILNFQTTSAVVLSDVTAMGLRFAIQMYPKASHLVLTDMGVIMSHKRETREFFFANLMPLTEEGLFQTASPQGIQDYKGAQRSIIGGITPKDARDNRRWWHSRGMARRILPFNYKYSEPLIIKIKDEIDRDNITPWVQGAVLKVPEIALGVEIGERFATEIRKMADSRAAHLGENGIDTLKQYRALARAHSLLRSWKNASVEEKDLEFLERIDPFVSWNETRDL